VRIRVLFFGVVKEITGGREASVDLAAGATLETVFNHYASEFPKLAGMSQSLVLARNLEFVPRTTALQENDEVAFLPPVSGGASEPQGPTYSSAIETSEGHFFAISRHPLDARVLAARLVRGEDGALVTFEGVVRNNTKGRATLYLDYEGYETMALKVMADLGRAIAASHAIGRIAMVHRLGRMEIGEASVIVAVSAPHRKPAFEAALEGINRLKKTVPIWKKEFFADGEVWVEGEWDSAVTGF
jgi:MoaE-MoaD fusion protein